MAKNTMNMQDSFLNQVRKDGGEIQVVMCDGSVLRGKVRGFDHYTIMLQVHSSQQLLYKHAISYITASSDVVKEKKSGDSIGSAEASSPERVSRPKTRKSGHKAPSKPSELDTSKETPKFNPIDLSNIRST